MNRLQNLIAAELRAFERRRPLDEHAVLYESFNGNGAVCNPEAIFRYLVTDPTRLKLRHIWSLSEAGENDAFRREFRHHPRVSFVTPGSRSYRRALQTSRYLISNATFDRQFSKRPCQIYLNTWHGTPLKKMGFDIDDHASRVANVMRNFLHADYLVSPNEHTTSTLFGTAHRLDGLFRGRILETGYPRIDRQTEGPATHASTLASMEERGLNIGGRRIILWAPTWRGRSFARPEDDADEQLRQVRQLQALVDADRFVVLLKTHQSVHRRVIDRPESRGVLIPNDVPANLILAVTDCLVTDYSSIFFDYLQRDRPIVFFAPDLAEYDGYRGLYLEPSEWPGPIVKTIPEVADRISDVLDAPLPDTHTRMRSRMAPHDDGEATRRVVDIVFDTQPTPHAVSSRRRVLFALPSTADPGRIKAAVDLLNRLPLDEVDVSVILSDSRRADYLAAQSLLDRRIRRFVRQGVMATDTVQLLARRIARRRHRHDAHQRNRALRRMWDDEWHRLVGDTTFDTVVDLAGSEPFWSTLLLHSRASRLVHVPADVIAPDKTEAETALAAEFHELIPLEKLPDMTW